MDQGAGVALSLLVVMAVGLAALSASHAVHTCSLLLVVSAACALQTTVLEVSIQMPSV